MQPESQNVKKMFEKNIENVKRILKMLKVNKYCKTSNLTVKRSRISVCIFSFCT